MRLAIFQPIAAFLFAATLVAASVGVCTQPTMAHNRAVMLPSGMSSLVVSESACVLTNAASFTDHMVMVFGIVPAISQDILAFSVFLVVLAVGIATLTAIQSVLRDPVSSARVRSRVRGLHVFIASSALAWALRRGILHRKVYA
ncbi:MAG: hypothetical protein AAB974_02720 [Patescibacteria group bacterium]